MLAVATCTHPFRAVPQHRLNSSMGTCICAVIYYPGGRLARARGYVESILHPTSFADTMQERGKPARSNCRDPSRQEYSCLAGARKFGCLLSHTYVPNMGMNLWAYCA